MALSAVSEREFTALTLPILCDRQQPKMADVDATSIADERVVDIHTFGHLPMDVDPGSAVCRCPVGLAEIAVIPANLCIASRLD